MSIDPDTLESLQRRWTSNAAFEGFRNAVLTSDASEEWFQRIPKLPHPWIPDELGDFRGVSFANLKLADIDLTSLRFDHADFSGSELRECSFQGVVVSDASFAHARLTRAHMIPIYGERVSFVGAEIDKSSLESSKLPRSLFSSARFNAVALSHADLSQSSLVGAQLESCRLDSTILSDTDLTQATFENCNLVWAVFRGAQMRGTLIEGCDMSGADFRGAHLDGARILGGSFGIVEQGDAMTPTRFDDTPEARKLVANSQAANADLIEWHPAAATAHVFPRSVGAGQACPRSGFWFSPARAGSRRHFQAGQTFPDLESTYGATLWQWDQNQDPPRL